MVAFLFSTPSTIYMYISSWSSMKCCIFLTIQVYFVSRLSCKQNAYVSCTSWHGQFLMPTDTRHLQLPLLATCYGIGHWILPIALQQCIRATTAITIMTAYTYRRTSLNCSMLWDSVWQFLPALNLPFLLLLTSLTYVSSSSILKNIIIYYINKRRLKEVERSHYVRRESLEISTLI